MSPSRTTWLCPDLPAGGGNPPGRAGVFPSRVYPLLAALLLAPPSWADTPESILEDLTRSARAEQPGFSPSASRGEQFYRAKQSGGKAADSCAACHGPDAKARGEHVKTHKVIQPLAPVANKERFTDPAKVEKWFRRNCKEVLGRACTAQEKADFTAYLVSIQ